MFAALALSGCTQRWRPQSGPGPVTFSEACPQRRAPRVEDFGEAGVRGVYHFVTQDASDDELGALVQATSAGGFSLVPMTVNLNGRDTLFAHGAAVLRSQAEVDAEFTTACRMGQGRVYLTHVRYNQGDGSAEQVRAR